jgi:ABC-2 type transport system ATP-binding protein
LSDVELVCDRISIMNYGKLVKLGRVDELLAEGRTEITASNVPTDLAGRLQGDGAVVKADNGRLVVTVADEGSVNDVVDAIRSGSGKIVSVVPLKRSLEEIFVETVGAAGTQGRRIGTMNTLTKDSD